MTKPMAPLSGNSTLIGLLADPVDHVRAPEFLDPLFAAHGTSARIVPMHVQAGDLAAALRGLRLVRNIAGVILTMPHKQAAVRLCDRLGREGVASAAVNAVRFDTDGTMTGDMFDGVGLVRAMAAQNVAVGGRRVLMLGAGGVARAIAVRILAEGVAFIAFADREAGQAADLAAALRRVAPAPPIETRAWPADPAGFDIVVNATPLGLHADDPPPLDPRRLQPEMDIVEVNAPIEWTAFRDGARRIGCRTVGGRAMADQQVPLYVEFFQLLQSGTTAK
jgi:shikimate dehydrogenase